ncbi:acyltransferase [Candidatus Lokiarchaeum ossiferum]|uniref:acyltransferase n=1 Tax=Candidatus Lokiarchaeum ossiferum TaxID=2951803 RepID=UPI00352E0F99
MLSNQKIITKETQKYFPQVDLLKGAMILLVIIDHAIPTIVRSEWGHSLWERISIPVFMILLGFNAAYSFKKRGIPIESKKSYGNYLVHKAKRYGIPFIVLLIISSVIGLIIYGNFSTMLAEQFDPHWDRSFLAYFILPFYGPGNWFIPVLFQAAIILPFLYKLYLKHPKLALFGSLAWEILVQGGVFLIFGHWTEWWPEIPLGRRFIQSSIFLYINALVIGFWIADHVNLSVPKQKLEQELSDPSQIPEIAKDSKDYRKVHFLPVLILIISISELALSPFIDDIMISVLPDPRWVSAFVTILLIWLTTGLYFYKPRVEFLITFIFSFIMCASMGILTSLYFNTVSINYETFQAEHATFLFILIGAIFTLPYLLQIFFSPKNTNWVIWVLSLVSGLYLCVYQYDNVRYHEIMGDYHFLVYPYSALIVLMVLTVFPHNISSSLKNTKIIKGRNFALKKFSSVGKASYHILLSQMLIFAIMEAIYGEHYFTGTLQSHFLTDPSNYTSAVWIYTMIMWTICVPLGIIWYLGEQWVIKKIRLKKNNL